MDVKETTLSQAQPQTPTDPRKKNDTKAGAEGLRRPWSGGEVSKKKRRKGKERGKRRRKAEWSPCAR